MLAGQIIFSHGFYQRFLRLAPRFILGVSVFLSLNQRHLRNQRQNFFLSVSLLSVQSVKSVANNLSVFLALNLCLSV